MKKILIGCVYVVVIFFMSAFFVGFTDGLLNPVDINGNDNFISALSDGSVEIGDKVRVEVTKIEDNPVLGKLVWLGDDMYIVGYRDADKVQPGDKIVFDVNTARSLFGKWALTDVK